LRIGILTERMLLGYGVDLVVDETARRMVESGHEVTLFVTRRGTLYSDAPYEIVDLMESAVTSRDIYTPHFMQDSMKVITPRNIDVWIIHTPPFYHWLPHLKPPVVMVEHGTPPGKFFKKSLGKELDEYTRERYLKIYRATRNGDGLVAISEYIRSTLPRDVQERVVVIRNGADHYPPASTKDVSAMRNKMGVKPDDIVVLWVGRIDLESDSQPYKGFDEFLQIVPVVLEKNNKVKIVAVGRSDTAAEEFLRSRGIIPLLNLEREEMPAAYSAADVFLNTSHWEGFNLPLVEAQFQGTPVVAYDLCAHPEVVLNGNSGFLVHSTEELCKKVVDLTLDSDLRSKLQIGARNHVSRFTWNTNAREMMTLLEACYNLAMNHQTDVPAPDNIKKDLAFYWKYSRRLVRREGIGTLCREIKGWISRRIR